LDNRSPITLATQFGGFCPKKMLLAQNTRNELHSLFRTHGEWGAFWEAHVRVKFPYVVSYSTNCVDPGVADTAYMYKITLDLEAIDVGTKGTATTLAGSDIVFFRSAAQTGGNYEWDTSNCIPLAKIVAYKASGKNDEGSTVWSDWIVPDWNEDQYKPHADVAALPADEASQAAAQLEAKNVFWLRADYSRKGKSCKSHVECPDGLNRCCRYAPDNTGLKPARCADGANAANVACSDMKPASNAIVFCTKKLDCSTNTNNKECCVAPGNRVAFCRKDVAVCRVPNSQMQLQNPSNPAY
jgi:hypothetical protein